MTIVVTRRAAKLTGVALDDTGQPTSSASVLLFSEDEAHWFPFSRRLRVVRPDADGQFSIANLPPGTYHLVALDYVEPGQHEDREFLAATRDEGTRVVLGAGATETTTVRIKKL